MKVLLFFSTLFGVIGILFLHFFAEAQEECDRISDQCADAGFAWETSACGSGFHFACRTYNPVGQEFHSKIEIRGAGLSPPIASQLLLPSSIQKKTFPPLRFR